MNLGYNVVKGFATSEEKVVLFLKGNVTECKRFQVTPKGLTGSMRIIGTRGRTGRLGNLLQCVKHRPSDKGPADSSNPHVAAARGGARRMENMLNVTVEGLD